MNRLATRRLIDASASLHPTERALLNLWVNRGFDDPALARLAGVEPASIAVRRERIVIHLSDELGLPPDEVRAALSEIAASSAAGAPTIANGRLNGANSDAEVEVESEPINGHLATDAPLVESALAAGLIGPAAVHGLAGPIAAASEAALVAPPEAAATPPAPQAPAPAEATPDVAPPLDVTAAHESSSDEPPAPRRRRGFVALAAGTVAVVAVILVVALGSESSPKRGRPVRTTPVAVSTSPTPPSPSPTVSRPPSRPLAELPGGVDHATGSVMATGSGKDITLRLSVSKLPAAHLGHYEVWLYNSIIDSDPLGRLRTGVSTLSLRLPANAHRFQWIDVSFQPVGVVFHSGASVLRAANPAAGRPGRKQRSARRGLQRAKRGSSRASTSK